MMAIGKFTCRHCGTVAVHKKDCPYSLNQNPQPVVTAITGIKPERKRHNRVIFMEPSTSESKESLYGTYAIICYERVSLNMYVDSIISIMVPDALIEFHELVRGGKKLDDLPLWKQKKFDQIKQTESCSKYMSEISGWYIHAKLRLRYATNPLGMLSLFSNNSLSIDDVESYANGKGMDWVRDSVLERY